MNTCWGGIARSSQATADRGLAWLEGGFLEDCLCSVILIFAMVIDLLACMRQSQWSSHGCRIMHIIPVTWPGTRRIWQSRSDNNKLPRRLYESTITVHVWNLGLFFLYTLRQVFCMPHTGRRVIGHVEELCDTEPCPPQTICSNIVILLWAF